MNHGRKTTANAVGFGTLQNAGEEEKRARIAADPGAAGV